MLGFFASAMIVLVWHTQSYILNQFPVNEHVFFFFFFFFFFYLLFTCPRTDCMTSVYLSNNNVALHQLYSSRGMLIVVLQAFIDGTLCHILARLENILHVYVDLETLC